MCALYFEQAEFYKCIILTNINIILILIIFTRDERVGVGKQDGGYASV